MASYIKFNCDYQLVYLAQTIITLNGFDNISQQFYYFYNFNLKLLYCKFALHICIRSRQKSSKDLIKQHKLKILNK